MTDPVAELRPAGAPTPGGADMVSDIFRSTVWNQTIPDELRGRLAGVELLSYSTGPVLGNARAGLVAAGTSVRFAIVSGGLLCIAATAAATALMRDFRTYDDRTNPHSVTQRAARHAPPDDGGNETADTPGVSR